MAPEPPSRTTSVDPLDDGSVPFYTIGQVARITGIQPAALELTDEVVTLPGVHRVLALRQRVSDLESELDRMRTES